MRASRRPEIPSLTIGLSLLLAIGWIAKPATAALYLIAFVLMVVVVERTYRRIDRQAGDR
jgi:hypothetical protein